MQISVTLPTPSAGITVVTGLALALALGPLTGVAHGDSTVTPSPDATSLLVNGQGHGHGHGLSQYGANQAAKQGLNHRRILAHYYPGTSVGRAGGTVKVLLSGRKKLVVKSRPGLRVTIRGGRSFTVARLGNRKARTAKAWRAVPASATRTAISYRGKRGWKTLRTVRGTVEFSAGGAPVTLKAGADSGRFRGALRSARPSPRSTDRDIVNVLGLESYLRGVVPLEMPALWEPAAVAAQAVAARSYAVHERATTNRGHFDVYDTTQSQVYGGAGAEHPAATRAVKATAREIRRYRGKPAFTQFSASNGGWMLANPSAPYLVSKADPYDPKNRWSVSLAMGAIADRFGSTYPLASISVTTHPGAGDWVDTVTLKGTNGATNTVSGETFRAWAGLKSASFGFAAPSSRTP